MKKLIILIFVFTHSVLLFGQQHSFDFLVNQYCKEAKKIDLDHMDRTQVFEANMNLGKELRTKYADTIEYILNYIQSNNDTLTQMEALTIYSKHYIHDIIYNCYTYLKINRIIINKQPTETKSMQYITLRVNDYLARHPEFTYRQVLDSAGYMGFVYGKDIPEQLQKDYDLEFVNPSVLIQYLLYKSDLYFKAWLYNQSMKLFE